MIIGVLGRVLQLKKLSSLISIKEVKKESLKIPFSVINYLPRRCAVPQKASTEFIAMAVMASKFYVNFIILNRRLDISFCLHDVVFVIKYHAIMARNNIRKL